MGGGIGRTLAGRADGDGAMPSRARPNTPASSSSASTGPAATGVADRQVHLHGLTERDPGRMEGARAPARELSRRLLTICWRYEYGGGAGSRRGDSGCRAATPRRPGRIVACDRLGWDASFQQDRGRAQQSATASAAVTCQTVTRWRAAPGGSGDRQIRDVVRETKVRPLVAYPGRNSSRPSAARGDIPRANAPGASAAVINSTR